MLICIICSGNFILAISEDNVEINEEIIGYTEDKHELKKDIKEGEVDVNKSVQYKENKQFGVSLLAQSKGFEKITTASKEYNIVFVIDNSGSMYGTSGRIQACVSAINYVLGDLAKYNNVKTSVVAYSSGSKLDYTTDDDSVKYISNNKVAADDILPLAHYDSSASIGYVDNYGVGNGTNYDYRNTLRWMYSSTGKKFYAGNTNTQAGIVKAYEVLSKANNKDTATPVIILMSDGEATNYAYNSNALSGYKYEIPTISDLEGYKDAFSNVYTQSHIPGWAAILSANYAKYSLNKTYKNECRFYTFGYALDKDFENYKFCLATLNPSNNNVKNAGSMLDKGYEKYGLNDFINNSSISKSVKEKYGISNLIYTDKYYEGTTKNIQSIYQNMVNQTITEKNAKTAIKSGTYLNIKDTIGDYFDICKDAEKNKINMTITQKTIDTAQNNTKEIQLTTDNNKIYKYSEEKFEVVYDTANNDVNFNIRADYLNNNQVYLSYNLELSNRIEVSEKEQTYYTNNTSNTNYAFTPEESSPMYKNKVKNDIKVTGSITLIKRKIEIPEEPLDEPEYIEVEVPTKKEEPLDEPLDEPLEEPLDEPLDEPLEEPIEQKIEKKPATKNKEPKKEEVKEVKTVKTVVKLPKTGM